MQLNPVRTQRLASLQSYLEADPENVQLRADIFDAALEAGDLEVAGQQVSVVLQKSPDAKPWLHRQAVLYLARKDYPAAQTALEALISMGVNDVAVLYNLAFALFVQGRVEAARDRLAPVVDAAGEVMHPALALWLRCMHHLAHLDEGLRKFDSYASAHTVTEEVLGVAGLMALDAGRTEDAGVWSARALAANANRLEALVVQGSLVLGRQDMAAAQALFERALAVNQTDGRSWSGLAFTYLLEQRLDLAHKAFHNAVRTMTRHIGTWIGLGWCEFMRRDLPAARQAFASALALDRNFGESHGSLAVVLVAEGKQAEAAKEVELALGLDKTCLSARYAQAMLSGEVSDPAAFRRLAQRVLARHRGPGEGQSLADAAFKATSR
ncbi:tetratricopeptide repeat protein [Ralstonia solanacearum]|uniref:tetratricopeptide repeat protein n=1 Tax=Ralstonia solanacearum TaxID=305 RepID=UPI00202A61B5|nr:tetratricopeptide repeat protein [Ralstonia solanacearum]MCL9846914.1 tetratricopeptide repeat protein [Ralstonia solanacearum]MDC6255653.1 tetratricopeptide repeat protein [Ralstonia solanacearum]MDC6260098.1 tetratricopeptide repeat protein [Ralstonia solanacearum]MDC6304972.1 tetratricopeptide repeat protein [Ralstonia solanacearum]